MADYSVSHFAATLADREAIRHCLMRYCRGIDRIDRDILDTIYWPGASDDHIDFVGTAEGFIDHAIGLLEQMDQTQHLIGNILIDMTGPNTANSESYFQAFHRVPNTDRPASDLLVGGRYIDRFEKRGDEWRIAARVVIIDWFREFPDSGEFDARPLGLEIRPGTRKPTDRSYALFDGDLR